MERSRAPSTRRKSAFISAISVISGKVLVAADLKN